MAAQQQQVPQILGLGILPEIRAKWLRIRAAFPRPRYTDQASRVDVRDATGVSLVKEFLTTFSVGGIYAELWAFKKNADILALASVYLDETTGEYVFGVFRNTWDPLDVYFDQTLVGTTPTFPAVTADLTPSIGYVTFRGVPPTV